MWPASHHKQDSTRHGLWTRQGRTALIPLLSRPNSMDRDWCPTWAPVLTRITQNRFTDKLYRYREQMSYTIIGADRNRQNCHGGWDRPNTYHTDITEQDPDTTHIYVHRPLTEPTESYDGTGPRRTPEQINICIR